MRIDRYSIRKFHIVRDKDPKKKLYIQYLHVKCIGIMSMSEVCKYKPTSFQDDTGKQQIFEK